MKNEKKILKQKHSKINKPLCLLTVTILASMLSGCGNAWQEKTDANNTSQDYEQTTPQTPETDVKTPAIYEYLEELHNAVTSISANTSALFSMEKELKKKSTYDQDKVDELISLVETSQYNADFGKTSFKIGEIEVLDTDILYSDVFQEYDTTKIEKHVISYNKKDPWGVAGVSYNKKETDNNLKVYNGLLVYYETVYVNYGDYVLSMLYEHNKSATNSINFDCYRVFEMTDKTVDEYCADYGLDLQLALSLQDWKNGLSGTTNDKSK
jgi:hypothetical protein